MKSSEVSDISDQLLVNSITKEKDEPCLGLEYNKMTDSKLLTEMINPYLLHSHIYILLSALRTPNMWSFKILQGPCYFRKGNLGAIALESPPESWHCLNVVIKNRELIRTHLPLIENRMWDNAAISQHAGTFLFEFRQSASIPVLIWDSAIEQIENLFSAIPFLCDRFL